MIYCALAALAERAKGFDRNGYDAHLRALLGQKR